ncbi:hypothetical protein H2248_001436 [Termitomyces sp. 'cryptogamus']|nr:hypothetical protein H2248_001436 [Termitomyces sp. 'cryptogamus']
MAALSSPLDLGLATSPSAPRIVVVRPGPPRSSKRARPESRSSSTSFVQESPSRVQVLVHLVRPGEPVQSPGPRPPRSSRRARPESRSSSTSFVQKSAARSYKWEPRLLPSSISESRVWREETRRKEDEGKGAKEEDDEPHER